jgi:hypothetical protein
VTQYSSGLINIMADFNIITVLPNTGNLHIDIDRNLSKEFNYVGYKIKVGADIIRNLAIEFSVTNGSVKVCKPAQIAENVEPSQLELAQIKGIYKVITRNPPLEKKILIPTV